MNHLAKFVVFVAVLLLIAPMANAQEPANATDQVKAVATQTIDVLWNADNPERIPDFFAERFFIHTPVHSQSSIMSSVALDGYYAAVLDDYHQAFPDLVMSVDHVAAEGDMVFLHISAEGTFDGEFVTPLGRIVSPSGDHLEWEDVFVYRFEDGKIAEWWVYSQLPLFGFDQRLSRFE